MIKIARYTAQGRLAPDGEMVKYADVEELLGFLSRWMTDVGTRLDGAVDDVTRMTNDYRFADSIENDMSLLVQEANDYVSSVGGP